MLPADPTLSLAERVDFACDRFEADWKAGKRPRVDDYVAEAPASDQEDLRAALKALELELRQAGSSVTASGTLSEYKPGSAAPADSPSRTRVGRFELQSVLGSGAFGKVYRAIDPQLGREVAVKVPLESTIASEKERQQFLKEARSAATINHPNVCQVYEVGEADGRPYIVMALVRGQSLAETLKKRKEPLPEKQAALIARKMAQALAVAHDRGIVHRDLKPANVMFDQERKDIVVMDFGLARGLQLGDTHGTQSGVIMGTPAYMSPEQARGDSRGVGPAGDIFSLGVILYELLTGVRPFLGTATEVIGKILHVEAEPPSKLRPGIDGRLEAICLKAMAKDPSARFATMQELAAALDAVLRAPLPTGPAADTAKATNTQRTDDEQCASNSHQLAEVFAVLSDQRKLARAETAAVVEAAMAKHRTPRWVLAAVGLCFFGILAVLGGLVFFTRSNNVKVTIELAEVDLADKTLSFLLDNKPISAAALASPLELSPGDHVLDVKRGAVLVKRMLLKVSKGPNAGIRYKNITPEPKPPEWKPLIESAAELIEGETTSAKAFGRTVKFEDGKLFLQGPGAAFRPKFTGRNYIVRANVLSLSEAVFLVARTKPGTAAGYQAFFNNHERDRDWPTCGLGKQHVGQKWESLEGTMQRLTDGYPAELAISVFNDQIAIYVNGKQAVQVTDRDITEGGISIGCYKDFRAALSDVAVCVLDDTNFTPDDIYPQQRNAEVERILAPEFLTPELKKSNLLRNGDFENLDEGWKFESWRNNRNLSLIVESPVHSGKRSLEIENRENDSVQFSQTISVQRNRRYLLSGWIKTKNIQYAEHDKTGAALYVYGWHEHRTARMPLNSDWKYEAIIFDSGNRNSVDVAVKLGSFAGTVHGTAWFDDLCVVEIPEHTVQPVVNQTASSTAEEIAKWQGTWNCVACTIDRKEVSAALLKEMNNNQVITGQSMKRKVTERTYLSNFRLDATQSPKHYDSDFAEMAHPGGPFQHCGIYELDGDRLRIILRYKPMGQPIERATWNDRGKYGIVYLEYMRSK